MTDSLANIKDIAVEIFLYSKENHDPSSIFLKTLSVLGGNDAGAVLSEYEKLIKGETRIVRIRSAEKLTENQKKKLETKIRQDYQGGLVFSYSHDEALVSGFCFQIEDQMFDGSLEALLK